MNAIKLPVSVLAVALIYLAAGAVGFAYHFPSLLTEILAVVAGGFLLRGDNWARWLAVAWIAFHVVLSAFHSYVQTAAHAVICGVIAWALFRPAAARYFLRGGAESA